MNLQDKSESYWKKTLNPTRRQISYFDEYFESDIGRKSLDYRINILLNQKESTESFLDIGCGYGAFSYELYNRNNNLKLAGIDISEEAIDFCKQKIENSTFVRDKFENINNYFEENSFDVVYSSGVMIHQSPESLNSLIDNLIRISKKYIIHFEDIGGGELLSGDKELNPKWRESNQLLWRNNLIEFYHKKGCTFYFNNNIPSELHNIGFTNYMVVDLTDTNFNNQTDGDRNLILDNKEIIMGKLKK